jgi:uncharacterized delta-60 repeat protein
MLAAALATAAFAACGDNDENLPANPDASVDAEPAIDAAVDAPGFVFTNPTPKPIALAPAASDYLLTATPGPDGTIFAAGPVGTVIGGPRVLTIVKIKADGTLDTTWGGGDGIVATSLAFVGANQDIKITPQPPSGKILVQTQIPNASNPADRDVAILRLNLDGTVDNTFGGNGDGIKLLDLSTAVMNGAALAGLDTPRGIVADATGTIYSFSMARATGTVAGGGPRIDTDWTVTKLSADGAIDDTFAGGTGRFAFNLPGELISEQARNITLLADGNLIIQGYADSAALGGSHALLVKLTPTGVLVPGFATGGIFHDAVLPLQFEVYRVLPDGNSGFGVTIGYGRASGTNNDFVSMRLDLTTGMRDTSFGGGANGGALSLDPSGMDKSDNGRIMAALPGGGFVFGGSCGPGNMPVQDACWVIIKSDGTLDTRFGTGKGTFVFNGTADGNDAFWGAAVSGNKLFLVGYRGGGALAGQTAVNNDDSYVTVFDLPAP